MTPTPGTKLGPYEILAPLGAGGMGEVYRARDTRLDREVAVKVLPQHLSSNPEVRARFEREAKTVSSLNHPHICTLYDVGREGDTDYLVMELIEGETLATRLEKGALPTAEVLRLGAQIADALDRAHRAGIIHRDLKPGNVMLTKSGAKLMDFGLARATGLATGSSIESLTQSPTIAQPLTAEGTIVGTFQYMSPEQLEGKEADARSDIWALGCVLYEMATGRRAFEGKSQASLIAAILEHEPAPIANDQPTSPPALDRLIRACIAKDPADRVQTAHDVRLQLEWLGDDSAGGARGAGAQASIAARDGRRPRRVRALISWVATIAVVAAIAFVAGRHSSPRESSEPLRFVRKTFHRQTIFSARFMPDGKTLVLSAALEGNQPRLFVIRPDYPEPQPVGPEAVQLLSISSRGELLVLTHASYTGHHRLFEGTLARMPLEGGAPREIMTGVREADWSPDGQNLAIIHESDAKDRLEFPVGKVLVESAGYLSDVRVSPRGDRVAFMEHPSKFDDRGSVDIVDLDGHKKVLASRFWGMEGMAWSPDGRSLYFGATDSGTDYVVRHVDLDGRPLPAQQNIGMVIMHDIAPDGTWVVTRDDTPTEVMFRAAGSTKDTDLSWLDGSLGPYLSADGKTVAFTDESAVAGPYYNVVLRPTAGGPIVRLGDGWASGFSPDGKSVLGGVYRTPPRLVVYPVGPGQATHIDLNQLENLSHAAWTPDGHILVSGNEPGKPPHCFLVDPGSRHLEPVGADGLQWGEPSPKGDAFIAQSPEGWSVYPMSGNGTGRPVPSLVPDDQVFDWAADGSAVFSFRHAQVPCAVDRVDIATGRRQTVATVGQADRAGLVSVIGVTLAADRRTLAYSTWNYTSVLYTVGRATQ